MQKMKKGMTTVTAAIASCPSLATQNVSTRLYKEIATMETTLGRLRRKRSLPSG
jgi:hypothetical protein